MTNQIATTTQQPKSLAKTFAAKYNMEPKAMMSTLKQTAFKQKDGEVTDSQMAMLMLVANEYNLNPFTKEIYAFPDKGGIVPIVGVDGWSRIINDHPQFDGLEFKTSDEMVIPDHGKECPTWMEVHIYRKDRGRPVVVREYIDEVYKPKGKYLGPWQTHTKRFLRHKTLIQGARLAFGYTGIFDEDEASNIIDGQVIDQPVNEAKGDEVSQASSAIETVAEQSNEPEEKTDVQLVIDQLNNANDRSALDTILADAQVYDFEPNQWEQVTAAHANKINALAQPKSKLEMDV